MEVQEAVKLLAEALSRSREFAALAEARRKVRVNAAYEKILHELDAGQERLNAAASQAEADTLARQLQESYASASRIPELRAYFTAAQTFGELFNNAAQGLRAYIDRLLQ